ncbi:MAG: TolC family protein, partial [Lewinellaceae bacterium]|nr:TolC family protein [Lewinellaceae bacterium]
PVCNAASHCTAYAIAPGGAGCRHFRTTIATADRYRRPNRPGTLGNTGERVVAGFIATGQKSNFAETSAGDCHRRSEGGGGKKCILASNYARLYQSGERNSPVANRFNAGLSIPLWRKQYRSRIDAAQTGVEIARQNLAAQSLRTGAEWSRTIAEVEQTSEALEDYAQQVLPNAQALEDASRRMFEGGLSDLPTYLRHGIEVLNLELGYWDLFARYREAQLKLRFIAGNL